MSPVKENFPIVLADFSGGEADMPFKKMPPKYSVSMINFYPTSTGGIAFVPGFLRVNQYAVPETLYNGHVFVKKDGTKIVLVAGGGKVYKVDGASLTSIKSGLNANAVVRFVTANNVCVFFNGVDAPQKYDGTTVSALGGTPPATAFKGVWHKGRLWMLERTNKMLASHSSLLAIEDYTTFSNAGYYAFEQILKCGDELTDIESYLDLLVFYFKNHIAIYSGNNPASGGDFQIVQQIEGAGAITGTVTALSLEHLFLSQIGGRSLRQVINSGTNQEEAISKNIADRLARAISDNPNGPYASCHFQRLGWWMLLIGDTIWTYAYNLRAWFRIATDGMITGLFADSDGSAVYLCGKGFLYKFDIGWTFDGLPARRVWDSSWLSFFKTGAKGFPKLAEIYAIGPYRTALTISTRYDLGFGNADAGPIDVTTNIAPSLMDTSLSDTWDAIFYMDPDDFLPTRFPLFGAGASMQMNISSVDTVGPMEISSIKVNLTPGGE